MTILTDDYAPTEVAAVTEGESLAFDWPSVGLDAIEVFELDVDGNRTEVAVQDYTVDFAGFRPLYTGGNVIFTRPYLADTVTVSIERNTRIYQKVDFPDRRGQFNMNTVEFVLDKLTMICQELVQRKCRLVGGPRVTTPITQLAPFYPYGPLPSSILDTVLDKLTQICVEIDAATSNCSRGES